MVWKKNNFIKESQIENWSYGILYLMVDCLEVEDQMYGIQLSLYGLVIFCWVPLLIP